jgi:hypothetical protein
LSAKKIVITKLEDKPAFYSVYKYFFYHSNTKRTIITKLRLEIQEVETPKIIQMTKSYTGPLIWIKLEMVEQRVNDVIFFDTICAIILTLIDIFAYLLENNNV